MQKVVYIALFLMTLNSCTSSWQEQEKFLLPSNCKLERQSKPEENAMSTINQYKVIGEINLDSLKTYPKNTMVERGWGVKYWHKATEQEIDNLVSFFQGERPLNRSLSNRIIKSLKTKDSIFLSYLSNKDDSDLDSKDYNTMNWIDMYFLEIDSKELIHISFGKF